MNGICITWEYDGYIDGVPYNIQEYNKNDRCFKELDVEFDILKTLKGFTTLQLLIYLFIDSFSSSDAHDEFPLIFFRITCAEIAEIFNEPVSGVEKAIQQLIDIKRLTVLHIEGEIDAYRTLK